MSDDRSGLDVLNATAQSRLRSIIERIERLEEDKAAVSNDLKEVFGEAKGDGFDVKILRKVVRLRKMDKAKRQEEEALLDLYLAALGDDAPAPRQRETRISIEFPGRPPISGTASEINAALGQLERTADDAIADADLYRQAVDIIARDRKGSTSYLQRRLQIGYNSAAQLMERMEAAGVVGPPNHAGKREILVAPRG